MKSTMRRRNRGRNPLAEPEPLDAILERAGESRFSRVKPPFDVRLWRDAVGARIADRADPIGLRDGVLLLRVASSVWAHELSLLAETLCARLRERGVEATQLRFRVAEAPLQGRAPEPRSTKTVPAVRALPQELADALRSLDDAELRAAIARAAAANLAWQTMATPAPPQAISEARRGARAPRPAESGSAPPDRTSRVAPEGGSRTRGDGRGRPR